MSRAWADRVKQTSTITGTGSYSLDATVPTGFQGFVAGWGASNSGYYLATDGNDWEIGDGTITDATPDTLSRDTIYASSNSDAAVNWSAADVTIVAVNPADNMAKLGTIATQAANSVALTGGTVDGVAIGGTTPAAAAFTGVKEAIYTASGSSAYTINMALYTMAILTIGQNSSIDFSNVDAGRSCTLLLIDGDAYTITWDTDIEWASGNAPILGDRDVLSFSVPQASTLQGVWAGGSFA